MDWNIIYESQIGRRELQKNDTHLNLDSLT